MSRVILLIVCALSMASCLVMQTGAMRSAGERPPQPLFPFPRVRPCIRTGRVTLPAHYTHACAYTRRRNHLPLATN